MPKIIENETDVVIRTLSKEGHSYSVIKEKMKAENINVSIASISRVVNGTGLRRSALLLKKPVPKFRRPPKRRNKELIQKVKNLATKENPATYRAICKKTAVSLDTICKIIHEDLHLETKKKAKVHKLTAENAKNRKTNCRKLYENHLAGDKAEFIVTLDEALVYLDDVNAKRSICYVNVGEQVPDSWVFEKSESFSKSFMVVGIITGRGALPLLRVPSGAKVDAECYVNYVLKPLFRDLLPSLYPDDMDKVFLHHDKATVHTAEFTKQYLEKIRQEAGISYIAKEDIPVKAPDASPLDFFGFGYLKQRLQSRRAKTLEGIWKVAKEEWSTIDTEMVKKVMAAWKRRLRLISSRDGAHIENTKAIHSKRI